MIQSMTGFGKAVVQLPNKKITIELKSLNSKNLDLNARIPSQYREKELELRNIIGPVLKRGKIDFSMHLEVNGEKTSASLNTAIVKSYIDQLNSVVSGNDIEHLKIAMRMPDAMKTEREEIDPKEYQEIKNCLQTAITALLDFRNTEGAVLEKDFITRIAIIRDLLDQVKKMDPDRISAVKVRLQKAISELKEEVDENRFEQELIYYLEKYDITEEKVRLLNHLDYFLETITNKAANGKKLGFITQEIGREINTIGSKSNYAPMQHLVVQMKDELEKIKEQLLNVL